MDEKRYIKTKTLYDNAQTFKNSQDKLNLKHKIERITRFVEGKQWIMSNEIKDYPKITVNFIKQIMKVRQAGIFQNNYSFLVNTLKFEDTKKIQYFLQYLYNSMKIREKNLKVIADNFKKGTSGLYFYWDSDTRAILDKEQGQLKCEVFDIRKLCVADPEIQDIQEQEWIIYSLREKVEAVRYKYPEKADRIFPDGYNELSDTQAEQIGFNEEDDFCTLYLKYYRNEEGQVCYDITTETLELEKQVFLNPDYTGPKEEVPNTLSINDVKENKTYEKVVFGLYPFAVYRMDEYDNCFYGLPGGYEYIEAQKSINAHLSYYDYNLRNAALGSTIYKKGVFGDQEISNDVGQIYELDILPNERVQDVVGKMPINQIPTDSINFSSALLNIAKSVSGTTNVQMGQADYSNQTAKATEMLLQRAKENTSDYAILFEEYMKRIAEVMFMFAKFYYDKKEFTIVEHGNEKDTNYEYKGQDAFKGEDYIMESIDFDIRVSPSSPLNEQTLQQLAMMSVQTGNLDMLSAMKLLPYETFGSFQELKSSLEKRDTTTQIMKQQEAKIQQQQQVLEQLVKEFDKRQETIQKAYQIIEEDKRKKEREINIKEKEIKNNKDEASKVMQKVDQLKTQK